MNKANSGFDISLACLLRTEGDAAAAGDRSLFVIGVKPYTVSSSSVILVYSCMAKRRDLGAPTPLARPDPNAAGLFSAELSQPEF